MTGIFVEITASRGSTPRDAGAVMLVTAEGTEGTIGGGALEHWATTRARDVLAGKHHDETVTLPLGPGLGQCCGGVVTLKFGREPRSMDLRQFQVHRIATHGSHPELLWLWGAGHVGRALVRACHPQAFKITWIDASQERFPDPLPEHVKTIPAADMAILAARSPRNVHHLIFTFSHDIDLALCAALLRRGAKSIGLIGSDTKWTRFQSRLRASGLDPSGITCPIGDKSLGKRPDQIAAGVVASLIDAGTKGSTT